MTAPSPSRPTLDRLFRVALVIVPVGVLGNIVFSLVATDRGVLASVAGLPRGYLLLALALGLVPWLTGTLRLLIWVRVLGHRLRLRDSFVMTLASDVGSALTPTAVGGGFLKWGMLIQRGVAPGAAMSLAALIMLEDAVFFLFALPTALLLSPGRDGLVISRLTEGAEWNTGIGLAVWLTVALIAWLGARLVFSGGLGRRAHARGRALMARARRALRHAWRDATGAMRLIWRHGKSRFALTLGLTAVQWSCRYSVFSALAAFLGAPVDPLLFFVLQWLVFTLMSLVPTPGATGGAEAVFLIVYGPFVPPRMIGVATAGWRFLTFYVQLALASILMTSMNAARRPPPAGPPGPPRADPAV